MQQTAQQSVLHRLMFSSSCRFAQANLWKNVSRSTAGLILSVLLKSVWLHILRSGPSPAAQRARKEYPKWVQPQLPGIPKCVQPQPPSPTCDAASSCEYVRNSSGSGAGTASTTAGGTGQSRGNSLRQAEQWQHTDSPC
jgi:hypothetical protein